MKKILVAFDGTSFSEGALDYALNFSKDDAALIVGVFIEDLSYVGYAALFGEDYFTFDARVLQKMEKEAEGKIEENISKFEAKCKDVNANYRVHLDKGVPAYELVRESLFADLILLGYQTFFSGVAGEGSTLKDVLIEAECPVLVVPNEYKPIGTVLLAYDSKPSSVFAIKQFTQLFYQMATRASITLLHITKSKEEATNNVDLMKEYLTVHYPSLNYETISGQADDAIMNFAEQQSNPLVVLGAYGRSGVSRFFTKSTAGKLLKEKALPVFVAHK